MTALKKIFYPAALAFFAVLLFVYRDDASDLYGRIRGVFQPTVDYSFELVELPIEKESIEKDAAEEQKIFPQAGQIQQKKQPAQTPKQPAPEASAPSKPTEVAEQDPVKPVVHAPAPLKMTVRKQAAGTLNQSQIIALTNGHRASAGLGTLAFNQQLAGAALVKANDMLARQYFAHESPTGEGPADLARQQGYSFILVGENLALGAFASDAELVDAWMASPGHRANILKSGFTEIGVAVVRGTFEGDEVWMAVQEFGTPQSACPQPDAALKEQLDALDADISELNGVLAARKQELEAERNNPGSDYNSKVDAYNELVNEYNALVEKNKQLASQYNVEVHAFNACIAEYT